MRYQYTIVRENGMYTIGLQVKYDSGGVQKFRDQIKLEAESPKALRRLVSKVLKDIKEWRM